MNMVSQGIRAALVVGLILASTCFAAAANPNSSDPRLQKAYRFEQGGWIYRPSRRIALKRWLPARLSLVRRRSRTPSRPSSCSIPTRAQRDWEFYRTTARQMLWPHIDAEYQQELQGIADGVKAHGIDLDVYDIVALNAFEEVPDYYVPWLNKQTKAARQSEVGGSGKLQRFHRYRKHDQGSPDRDRPQQLDELSGGRAMGDRVRHSAAAREPDSDGRFPRR